MKLPILPFRDLVGDGEVVHAVLVTVFSHRGFERGSGGDAAQVHENHVDGVAPRAVLACLHAVDVNIALLVGDFHGGPEGFLERGDSVEVLQRVAVGLVAITKGEVAGIVQELGAYGGVHDFLKLCEVRSRIDWGPGPRPRLPGFACPARAAFH